MTYVHRIDTNLPTVDVGRPSSAASAGEEWESFKILFHGFSALPSALGIYTQSPEFKCNGHRWRITLYPGGRSEASAGNLSLYLGLCSGSGDAMATFELSVLDKFQRKKNFTEQFMDGSFVSDAGGWGWDNFCYRSYILNQSNNILDDNGTLAVIVSIKRDSVAHFVPNNPMSRMITGMFLDEETSDICFEVCTEVDSDDWDEVAPLPVTFHAHSQILQGCAPMIASLFLFGSDGEEITTASINDVKPTIFRHLLHYVYGGSVRRES
ncbi:BTB/POZ and MATH domain-containing protein [Skeletonema marinoi]|uniref:BTB/POZ and MATH domain-containing protein n=1 Tax=Skeletonema marinoi TaxID=267567 RepID=A0AAD8Y5D4_9STRA|nr:BTB/POZ and MATH domain-containing protein [Skeletonema marinoi]